MAARHSGSDQSPPLGSSCGGRAWSRGLPVRRRRGATGGRSELAVSRRDRCAVQAFSGGRHGARVRPGAPVRAETARGRTDRLAGAPIIAIRPMPPPPRKPPPGPASCRHALCTMRPAYRPQNGALTLPERMSRSRPYMVQCASRWSQRPRGCPVNCWSTQGAVRPQSGWISVGQGRQSGQIAQSTSPSSAMRGLRRVDAAAEPGTATYFFSQPISSGAPMTP